jgi:hypothetical protein
MTNESGYDPEFMAKINLVTKAVKEWLLARRDRPTLLLLHPRLGLSVYSIMGIPVEIMSEEDVSMASNADVYCMDELGVRLRER